MLKSLVDKFPGRVDVRALYADALQQLRLNPDLVIEQYRRITQVNPGNVEVSLRLINLLQDNGKFNEARQELERIATLRSLSVAERRPIARTSTRDVAR